MLAVRILHPCLKCIIIAARGPTSDKAPGEIHAFWDSITQRVLDKFPGWKVILLCDSNAHVGSCSSSSISVHGAQTENGTGEVFHTWLLRHGIWLPSTWSSIHRGDHHTYLTPDGQHQHRLDFVGLSHNWPLDSVATHVAYDLDGSLTRCDHFAAVCSFRFISQQSASSSTHRGRKPKLDRDAAARLLRYQPHFFADLAWIPWDTDVHRHAVGLATATLGGISPQVPFARYHRRKRHLQDLTWNLINWKRQLRKHQIDGIRRLKFGFLREIFVGWRNQGRRPLKPVTSYALWLKKMHIKLALLDFNLRKIQPIVQHMIRADDAHYYKQLAMKAGRIDNEDGLQGLWKEVRGTLPKWKSRGTQQRHDIDDALCQHFAGLEAGTQMPFETLYRNCIQFQNQVASSTPTSRICLHDLPTLFEIEQTCRKTTSARAAGLDSVLPEVCRHGAPGIAHHIHNMVFKIACSQAEPIWYKGGLIHPIYKMKGAMDDPTSYRGVVLLDVFGKKFHAWLRSRLLPLLQARRSPGQLGGLPHEQTLTGAHLLRVHGQVARAMHLSSAVVFVDVRAAFHHMLRELIFLWGETGLCLEEVLSSEHFELEALRALLQDRCSTSPEDFPGHLRRLADDVHRHTWYVQAGTTMANNDVMATARGTRPGSPVADVGFNLLMCDILKDLHARLAGDDLLTYHHQNFPVSIPPITWVDDLAVPVVAMHPQNLEDVLQRTLQHVHGAFYTKGLQINYDKGKTEAVLMFRGPMADDVRRRFFKMEHEAFITTSTDTHVFRVRAVPSYKHLGIRYQMDADLEHEVSCRIGQARTAFHEVKRPIFKNEFITHRTRIQLMQSLVFSKMLYGSGTWYEIPRRTVQKLESTIMRFFRSILNCGFWNATHITDEQLRAQHSLPTFRTLLATSRLRYLAHVASHDHDYHRDLLYEERKYNRGWLYEVEDDLAWMKTCISPPDLPDLPTSHDTWPSFLQWLQTATTRWKTWVKRTMQIHHLREGMAVECIAFHQQIFEAFKDRGFSLHQPGTVAVRHNTHSCPECLAVFTTSTAVAVHRAKKHGIHSPMRDYVQSATCPGCLRDMWTTQRVLQHLRYRPNRCMDRILTGGIPRGHVAVHLPPHLMRVKRLPASHRRPGPLLPLPHEKARVDLRTQLRECEAHGAAKDFWSEVNPTLQQLANDKFTTAAHHWYSQGTEDGEELFCNLLETAQRLPFPQLIQEKCIIRWIECTMWEACAEWSPSALEILEREHMQILQIFPVWMATVERDRLRRLLQSEATPTDWDPIDYIRAPHPVKRPRAQPVSTRYGDMEQEEQQWKHITIVIPTAGSLVAHQRTLMSNCHYIIHLYSGRRRAHDIQWHLENMLGDVSHRVYVLSIDTAVDPMCDINSNQTWGHLLDLATSGLLLALLLGPPCETWSSARHEALRDETGQPINGPRPLRSAHRPWGLEELCPREYRQIQTGMRLLLRGLILVVHTVLRGGSALLEHPAKPKQENRASICRTAIIELILRSGCFRTHTFGQWKFHAKGTKPTTFLYGNLPCLPTTLRSFEDCHAVRPQVPLVGRDTYGNFQTASAKEYPPLLNAAMAACVKEKWLPFLSSPSADQPEVLTSELSNFLNSLHLRCSEICEHRSWLPDYQGR